MVDPSAALQLMDRIDRMMVGKLPLQALSSEVFATLDNVNASRQDIEMIRSKVGEEVAVRLFAMAGSVYFGNLRCGEVNSFFDVVSCLGMQRTKALIIALTSFYHARHDPDMEMAFARSFATSIMTQILAVQCGFRDEAVKKAELCGLFLETGKKVMILYKKMYTDGVELMDDDFIESYHPYLGATIATRYGLPDYVRTVILARTVIMEENHISLAGIVHMAYDTVRASFAQYGNRLVLKCQTPRPATDVTRSLEAMVTNRFQSAGLEKYLHIIRIPRIYEM